MEKEKIFPQEPHFRSPHLRASFSTATTIVDPNLLTTAFGLREPIAEAWTKPMKRS
jgi:hypothetical protein